MKPPTLSRNGSALVITLALLVILTLMVIGMTMLMRTEQKASVMLDRDAAARQLAMVGVMRVIATLRETIPATLSNNRYYASMPGMVVGVDNSGPTPVIKVGLLYSTATTTNIIDSSSLTPGVSLSMWQTVTATADKMFNINRFDLGARAPIIPVNDFYTISATSSFASDVNLAALQVGWLYVSVPTDTGSMIIGRFAYWTDDESCRINIQSAWRRSLPTSSLTILNTSSVDLRSTGTTGSVVSITAALADNIRNYRSLTARPFYTPEHLKLVNGITEEIYQANKFYLTNFGTPNLGTLSRGSFSYAIVSASGGSVHFGGDATNAGVPNYGTFALIRQSAAPVGSTNFGVFNIGTEAELDIFGRPKLNFNTLTFTGVPGSSTINLELYTRLSATRSISTGTTFTPAGTWTLLFPGTTRDFLSKYPMYTRAGLGGYSTIPGMDGLQLIANMIEFTRGSNTQAISAPIATTGSLAGLPVLNGKLSYLGLKRSPYLNELIANGTASVEYDWVSFYSTYSWRLAIEIINPFSVTFTNYRLFYDIEVSAEDSGISWDFPLGVQRHTGTLQGLTIPPGYTVLNLGVQNADTIVADGWEGDPHYCTFINIKVNQFRLMTADGYLRDYLAKPVFDAIGAVFTQHGFHVPMNLDNANPYVSQPEELDGYNNDNNTESASRAISIGKDDPRVPTVWWSMGTGTPGTQNTGLTWNNGSNDSNENNIVLNHSTFYFKEAPIQSLGELGYIHTGTPWRTLRMQPRSTHPTETDAVPDWALWEIFKLDGEYTSITPVTGRININQRILHASSSPAPLRRAPVFALLGDVAGSAGIATNTLGSLTDNIIFNNTRITQTSSFGPHALAGAILEVASITNGATTDAGAEHIARLIAPMVTARSRQFTVWAVGQTIIDNEPKGIFNPDKDIISGEARTQVVIERDPIFNTYRIIYQRPFSD